MKAVVTGTAGFIGSHLTDSLPEAALGAGRPVVVAASSSSVYGDAASLPLREDEPCRPVSPCGVTKLAAENLGVLYDRNFGLHTVGLRHFTAYGPRQRPDRTFHPILRAALDAQLLHVYDDGRQTRDFTFVSDIVAATRAAAVSGRPGSVYNVGGGERVELNQVLRLIEEISARPHRIQHEEDQKGDMRDTFADTTAAARDLDFHSRVGLTEGLEREWDWLRGRA